jgi:hypothetical protein
MGLKALYGIWHTKPDKTPATIGVASNNSKQG